MSKPLLSTESVFVCLFCSITIDKLTNDIYVHARLLTLLNLERVQLKHNLLVGLTEDALNLVNAERAPTRIILTILEVYNVNMLVSVPLVTG